MTNSQEEMSSIPLLVFIFSLFFFESSSGSSIVFTTLGRSRYTFDIFATPLTSPSDDLRLTDGISVNFNGFFTSSSLLFISERNSSSNIYSLPIPFTSPSRRELLPLANPLTLLDSSHRAMIDRPSLSGDHLIYVSTHHPSPYPRSSWAAVYSTHLPSGVTRRLTPSDSDTADFSPSVSPSGLWTAVASTGDHPWSGEVQELNTSIYLVRTHDGSERTLLINHAGWPCWGTADSTLFFHRRSSDGWWSIYRAIINTTTNNPILVSIERITSPGFHAFTPAATAGDPNLIAVATRRPTSNFRHIELIDLHLSNPNYIEITRPIAPNSHHYNPFISPDATMIGYHRCRKGNGDPPLMFENIRSPSSNTLSLLRIDGSFPSFSPDGSRIAYVRLPGLFVVNSDGSGGPVEVFKGNAFGTSWDWKRRGVIYSSYGPDFASERTQVDVISITLDEDYEPLIKRLTVNGENNAFPSPSPDGKWVVFRSGRSGHKNLYIMDAVEGEAAGIHRLTEGPWSDTMCNWSPDGEWIAFASDRDNPGGGGFAIYLVHPNPSARRPPASMRWSFLRRACLSKSSPQPDNPSQMGTRNTSLKTTGGFNLISSHRLHAPIGEELGSSARIEDITGPRDACICYNLPVEPVLKLILIQRMDPVDLTDFEISTKYDIDTTGLVRCWPTEDVLAFFCINNPNLFRSKRVLELGSGYGLAGLVIAATTNACEVVISDGNPQVVNYIQHNICVNAGVFGDTKVNPITLHWNQEPASDILNSFDVIVASDCTFFKEFHDSLARTVKSLLKHSETAEAIFLGPKRGDSLDIFLEKIKEIGMCYELVEKYDSRVWNIHQKLINGEDASWPNYDQDHCYPFMLRIKFKSP